MARSFNGTTDRIDYGCIDGTIEQAQTFSALVYSDNSPGGMEYILTQNVAANNAFSVNFRIRADRVIHFLTKNTTIFMYRKSDTEVFPDAQFFHLLYTWDGSATATNIHFYVNGSEVAYGDTVDGVGNFEAPSGTWSLGGPSWDDNLNFDGKLAEAGWWNRVLDAKEIAILAARYSPRFVPNGLKFAPDLIRNQRDFISGEGGTLDGTSAYPHPRIIYPHRNL